MSCAAFAGLLWILNNVDFDKFSTFENYLSDDGQYTVRTRSEDFVKLVDGKSVDSRSPSEGILIIRRLDKTWDPEWGPVCFFNFNDERQACIDLGFPNGALGFYPTNVEAVNGGEWEISEGWRHLWQYGKYPDSEIYTGSQPHKFYNDKARRNFFIEQNPGTFSEVFEILLYKNLISILTHAKDVSNVRKCNEDKEYVWLVCDNSLTSDPRTITDISPEPTG